LQVTTCSLLVYCFLNTYAMRYAPVVRRFLFFAYCLWCSSLCPMPHALCFLSRPFPLLNLSKDQVDDIGE
jgi:hypothetical protein